LNLLTNTDAKMSTIIWYFTTVVSIATVKLVSTKQPSIHIVHVKT